MTTDDQTDPRGLQRKRPESVDSLASTVISVLRGRQVVSSEGLRQFVLDHMMRAVLSRGAFSAQSLLFELRGYRLQIDTVIDLYVPKVARLLGDGWVEDRISFAEVTIAVMRLQSLLAEASAADRVDTVQGVGRYHTLVLVPQGEQHFLGASVLACQIRRMGHEVDMSFDEEMGSLSARLMQDAPDMILITCSRRETLESVANTVHTIRQAVPRSTLLAVGGAIKMKNDDVMEMTGTDIVTSDAEEALAFCARRRCGNGAS
jgi:methanogenic corrinoid protein MtbC1